MPTDPLDTAATLRAVWERDHVSIFTDAQTCEEYIERLLAALETKEHDYNALEALAQEANDMPPDAQAGAWQDLAQRFARAAAVLTDTEPQR